MRLVQLCPHFPRPPPHWKGYPSKSAVSEKYYCFRIVQSGSFSQIPHLPPKLPLCTIIFQAKLRASLSHQKYKLLNMRAVLNQKLNFFEKWGQFLAKSVHFLIMRAFLNFPHQKLKIIQNVGSFELKLKFFWNNLVIFGPVPLEIENCQKWGQNWEVTLKACFFGRDHPKNLCFCIDTKNQLTRICSTSSSQS